MDLAAVWVPGATESVSPDQYGYQVKGVNFVPALVGLGHR
jgi:hypothetical protein